MPVPDDRDTSAPDGRGADHGPGTRSTAPGSSEPGASSAPAWRSIAPGLAMDHAPLLGGKRIALSSLSLLLVIALLVWGLPWAADASWPEILRTLGGLPAWAAPTMALLGLGALALEAWTVRTAAPGSRYSAALQGHAEANALALVVPGGGMLSMGLLGWILRRTGLSLAVVITGILTASLVEALVTTVLVPLLGGIAYLVAVAATGARIDLPAGALWAAGAAVAGSVIALALFSVLLRRPVLAGLLQTGIAISTSGRSDPDGTDDAAELAALAPFVLEQRDALVRLLQKRPLALLGPTVAARVLQWLALVLAIKAVGGSVPLLLVLAIFALGRVLSLVPLTPGGAGITETVGAAALVGLGLDSAASASAMLLLVIATLVTPLVAGGLAAALSISRQARRIPE